MEIDRPLCSVLNFILCGHGKFSDQTNLEKMFRERCELHKFVSGKLLHPPSHHW
jgi:hypothetical protein